MIVYRGRGGLVAIIIFGCLLGTELFTRFYFRDSTYYQQHGWPKAAGFLIAAALVWSLSRGNRDDTFVGVEDFTRESVLRKGDTLYLYSSQILAGCTLCVRGNFLF